MTYRPKALFCDVDRTILTHDHELRTDVVEALLAAQAAGMRVVLASARSPRGLRHVHDAIGLRGPAICFNGAWSGCFDPAESWSDLRLDRAVALQILAEARSLGLVAMWYCADVVHALREDAKQAGHQASVTRDCLDLVSDWGKVEGGPLKLMLVTAPDRVAPALEALNARCGALATIVRSGPGLIEVVRHGVSKALATAELATRFGLLPADCAAAGDSDNDLDMLRWAGIPLTVANGTPEARALARFTGGHCDEGGLVAVIDWLLKLPLPPPGGYGTAIT